MISSRNFKLVRHHRPRSNNFVQNINLVCTYLISSRAPTYLIQIDAPASSFSNALLNFNLQRMDLAANKIPDGDTAYRFRSAGGRAAASAPSRRSLILPPPGLPAPWCTSFLHPHGHGAQGINHSLLSESTSRHHLLLVPWVDQ